MKTPTFQKTTNTTFSEMTILFSEIFTSPQNYFAQKRGFLTLCYEGGWFLRQFSEKLRKWVFLGTRAKANLLTLNKNC